MRARERERERAPGRLHATFTTAQKRACVVKPLAVAHVAQRGSSHVKSDELRRHPS